MPTVKMYARNGSERGTVEVSDSLFGCEVNEAAVHQAVVAYLANQRQGTASAKERSEVKGGGRKPFRQKGTGRARQGTSRSPLHRGGGVVFPPHPRDYRQALPKKVKRLALRSALSSRTKDGAVIIVDELRFDTPKTKEFAALLAKLDSYGSKVLFVMDKTDEAVVRSARNIPRVRTTLAHMLNTYEVLWAEKIIMTEGALKVVEEVFKS
jgi:large subunit ribosomal protein L4